MGRYWPDLHISDEECKAVGNSAVLAHEINNEGYRDGYRMGFVEAGLILEKLIFQDGLALHEAFRLFFGYSNQVSDWVREKGDACQSPVKMPRPPYTMEPAHPGFIYFLRADNGLYKIGKATVLDRRIRQLGIRLPYKLELIHAIGTDEMHYMEKRFHIQYAEKRIRGEWFALTDEDITIVKKTKYILTGGIVDDADD